MVGYVRSLDGIRALAILLVMLFHFYYVLEIGWIGVQIFFVLSGYLITNILINSKEKSDLSTYLKRFYWRRTLRIFPLYYAYLIIVTGYFLLTGFTELFGSSVGYLYSYTYNLYPLFEEYEFDVFFTHFWSLSVEEQFYLVWPIIIFVLNRQQMRFLIIFLICSIPLFRMLFAEWILDQELIEAGEVLYRFTLSHFDAFAWGGAISVFKLHEKISRPDIHLYSSFLLMLGAGVAHYFFLISDSQVGLSSLGYPIGGMENYQHIWSYTLLNYFSASLILFLISRQSGYTIIRAVFENRVLVSIGKLSYGMYVYHWIILAIHKQFINPLIGNMVISFIIYLIGVYVVSYLSFHYLEMLFLRLKDKKFN